MKNEKGAKERLAAVRTELSHAGIDGRRRDRAPRPDRLERGRLHEAYAISGEDAVAVNAYGLGLAIGGARGRPVVWALDEAMRREAGRPHGPGLNEMGLDASRLLLVHGRDASTLLAVGEEALRSPAVGAVVLSLWGEARALTLTASRRLALAAQSGGSTLFLVRAGAEPAPSAAETRWSVRAVASTPLEANAPGRPAFSATLLRHRGGAAPRTWIMEWDREGRSFIERSAGSAPLSGALVPLAAQREADPGVGGLRHAG